MQRGSSSAKQDCSKFLEIRKDFDHHNDERDDDGEYGDVDDDGDGNDDDDDDDDDDADEDDDEETYERNCIHDHAYTYGGADSYDGGDEEHRSLC